MSEFDDDNDDDDDDADDDDDGGRSNCTWIFIYIYMFLSPHSLRIRSWRDVPRSVCWVRVPALRTRSDSL